MKKFIYLLILSIFISCAQKPIEPLSTIKPNSFIITFGSCNQQNLPQPLWKPIREINPNLFIWTGDIVYADADKISDDHLEEFLNIQKNIPDYVQLKNQTKIIGTWDDHDFGVNNGGKKNSLKRMNQKFILDFLDEPQNSPRRKQNGLYTSYTFTHLGNEIKVILLDARFNRDDPGLNADILGSEEWSWLEKELNSSKAKVHLIISGVQVLANEHPFEKWGDFPKSKDKIFNLIKSSKAKGVIFISGDRHFAEISQLNLTGLDYPLVDITSSGMTHFYADAKETNSLRVGNLFAGLNFGIIAIQWENDQSLVSFEIRDQSGNIKISHLQEYPF